jgi:glycosyltransferase involved in cell wall biosynthesis
MRVLFAPDYRKDNPYQHLLAEALAKEGVEVDFLQGYRRAMPLARSLRNRPFDILHLHWPEAYFPQRGDGLDRFRVLRLPIDLRLALMGRPLVLTAHNLWPHHHARSTGLRFALGRAYRGARRVIAHSPEAARLVTEQWAVPPNRIEVIPHGNQAEHLPLPDKPQNQPPYALNFGTISPYKGLEELIVWWRRHRPKMPLRIVGIVNDPDYPPRLAQLIEGDELIQLRAGKVSEWELAKLILAARVVVINHTAGLTSAVAALARSLGTNVLLPARLAGVDLMEPHPSVFRFSSLETDFATHLETALNTPRLPRDEDWWRSTSWQRVAEATIECYRKALNT